MASTTGNKSATVRTVPVNRHALTLFNRIGLRPPETGQYDADDLDAQLSGCDIATRMEAKAHLIRAGLLNPGRRIEASAQTRSDPNAFEKLPVSVRSVMTRGGIEGELDANGGTITLSQLDAAAQDMPIADRFLVKTALGQFGLLRDG